MYKSFKKSCLIFLSAVLAAMLIAACAFMLSPKTAHAEEVRGAATVKIGEGDATTYGSIEEAWAAANNAEAAATVKMYADATITDTFAVAAGKNITLDLNGCMLKYNGEWTRPVIDIQGGTFTLEDKSDKTTPHTILSPVTNEEVTINGGLITGGKSGGIFVDNNGGYYAGTFTMKGGTISGNTSSWSGGGVFVGGGDYELPRSTFIMTGGTISENKAGDNGGGVFVAPQEIAGGESLNLTARSNTVNKSGDEEAGGLFEMTGGTISGNSARMGGGVYVGYNGFRSKFEISGAPKITGNKANGVNDNVYLEDRWDGNDNAIITVTGELEEGAQIGVTLAGGFSGAFTSGYGENNKDGENIIAPDKYFNSDKDGYFPDLENGEVKLSDGVATVTVDGVETAYGSIQDAWTYANGDSVTTAATVKMYADAQTTDTLTVADGKNITLDLNGYMLKYNNDSANNSVITVEGMFTLCDSKDTGVITGGNTNNGGGVYVEGTFTMLDGEISGNNCSYLGGGVYVAAGGTFTMENGTISDNTASAGGGGVHIDGTFTMENGTISGNTTSEGGGGGVSVARNAEFTMTGGEISENEAFNEDYAAYGGGVFVSYQGTFIMENGTISGNTAKTNGGGLCIDFGGANVSVSGTPNITGNKVVMDGNEVTDNVYMLGGAITVTGELEEGAQIGVSNTGAVATGFTQEGNPADFFIPDDPANNCVYVSDKTSGTVTVGKHDLVHHEATAATVENEGNKEYWSCDKCDKYFEDEAAETEITDKTSVTLPKLTPETPTPAPAAEPKSYWWLFLLLIPIAIGVGGVMLGIHVYKKEKENNL